MRVVELNAIHVADVGDGLCMAISTLSGSVVQIDIGGKDYNVAFDGLQRILKHFGNLDVFVLSHFHIDHYNGLLHTSLFKLRQTWIVHFFYSTRESARPPKTIDDKKTLSSIKRAITDFEKALEEDEEVRRVYNRIKEEEVFGNYFEEQGEIREEKEYLEENNRYVPIYEKRKLPEAVRKANSSLLKAANHLSLALFEDNRFLFLGDAESHEIKQIVDDLKSKGRTIFSILITPHHGTHWHDNLRQIRCTNSITSNGKKLCSRMRQEIKMLPGSSFATFANGDIVLPKFPTSSSWEPFPYMQ